jgi:hypothetical protein
MLWVDIDWGIRKKTPVATEKQNNGMTPTIARSTRSKKNKSR